ncbi:hypothetical protein ACS3SW_13525 [Roseobacteraceae bacterium S113]
MKVMQMIRAACALSLLAGAVSAQDREVRLYAPEALVETGLMRYILPRFSLKTQVRVVLVPEAEAEMALGAQGRPLMQGAGAVWHLETRVEDADTDRFGTWLRSDVGQRTIMGFAPEGTALFAAPEAVAQEVVSLDLTGDAQLGHQVSLTKCTRCHAVDDDTIFSSIGSTPSFAVLRSFGDWQGRFEAFYVLKPHGAFTQIEGLTAPFPIDRPSPIAPITLTLEEVEAVVAYVAGMAPADLGQPLESK